MLRAERKKSVGCVISKSDERDIARIAKRCVLDESAHITAILTRKGEKLTHLFFIAVLLNTRSSSARDIIIV
jgi:hypothetical protein